MARKGRKRKLVERYPSGQPKKPSLKQLKDLELMRHELEMAVVLRQPHRNGDRHHWRGSALGRFVLTHRLRGEFYDAGQDYNRKVRRLWAVKGVPSDIRLGGATAPGDGPSVETVRKWEAEMARLDKALRAVSKPAYASVRAVAVLDNDLAPQMQRDLIAGLQALAVEMGLMRAGEHPFA